MTTLDLLLVPFFRSSTMRKLSLVVFGIFFGLMIPVSQSLAEQTEGTGPSSDRQSERLNEIIKRYMSEFDKRYIDFEISSDRQSERLNEILEEIQKDFEKGNIDFEIEELAKWNEQAAKSNQQLEELSQLAQDMLSQIEAEVGTWEETMVETPVNFDSGHIAWMLISSALVLMMTGPGLALFYCGLVRKKNVLGVMMQCLFLMGMNSILWVLIGYSLAFSEKGPVMFTTEEGKPITWIGGLDKVMLRGVGPNDTEPIYPAKGDIPEELFMVFQMMFFIITPALICGGFAERMKFSAMVVFTALWGLLVYCPLAHWVWGPTALLGSDSPLHSLDFAGGLVVHASSGVTALVCALVIGKRIGYGEEPIVPHNLTYTVIGACLLWVGWFGFNAGSAGAANELAVNAFVVTHLCASAGLLGWAGCEWIINGKPSVLGACSGVVTGLVVITPASGFVTPGPAIVMGLVGGGVCYFACTKIKNALGYDDSLDAFGVHGVGGTLGALFTGIFVSKAVMGEDPPDGVFLHQIISLLITYALAIVVSFVILKVIDRCIGLRVSHEEEIQGLDVTQHNEEGYLFL